MKNPQITTILASDCVGNSRKTINDNLASLSASLVDAWWNPKIAYTKGSLGAIRVRNALNVAPDGSTDVSVDDFTIKIAPNNNLYVNTDNLRFLPLSGGVMIGPVTFASQPNTNVGINVPASPDYRLNIEGRTRIGGSLVLPNNGGVSEIWPSAVGTGYNTSLKVSDGFAIQHNTNGNSITFSTATGDIYTPGQITIGGSIIVDNSNIKQTNPNLGIIVFQGSRERMRVSAQGDVHIGSYDSSYTMKFLVDCDAAFSRNTIAVTPPAGDSSTKVATTEFTSAAISVVTLALRNLLESLKDYVKIAGSVMTGDLTTPNLIANTSITTGSNSATGTALTSNGRVVINSATTSSGVRITQTGQGLALQISNGATDTLTVTKDGAVDASGTIVAAGQRTAPGLPDSPTHQRGFTFVSSTNSGMFLYDVNTVSLFANNVETLRVSNTDNKAATYLPGFGTLQNSPVENMHIANKLYVDTKVEQAFGAIDLTVYATYDDLDAGLSGKVNRAGDTMQGFLKGPDPVQSNDYTTKKYVDDLKSQTPPSTFNDIFGVRVVTNPVGGYFPDVALPTLRIAASPVFTDAIFAKYLPVKYQWYFNDQPISGATSSAYTIPANDGVYKCSAYSPINVAMSAGARCDILRSVRITSQSPSVVNITNGSAPLFVTAGGTSPQYQWTRNGTAIDTNSSINATSLGTYACRVYNSFPQYGWSGSSASTGNIVVQCPITVQVDVTPETPSYYGNANNGQVIVTISGGSNNITVVLLRPNEYSGIEVTRIGTSNGIAAFNNLDVGTYFVRVYDNGYGGTAQTSNLPVTYGGYTYSQTFSLLLA